MVKKRLARSRQVRWLSPLAVSVVVLTIAATEARIQAWQTAAQTPETKKPAAGPAIPQSTHYPILLLAQGPVQAPPQPEGSSDQPISISTGRPWSLRLGQKGPERLDREGYPPIPLEPADVSREGASEAWIYHAKDSQTGATVSVHIARNACAGAVAGASQPQAKFVFTAVVEHSQIGTMEGCARVATEIFPKIKNQTTTDDDDDETKDTPPPPTVTHFTAPVAITYITSTDKMVVKRGAVTHVVPGKGGYSLCLSHDGKKLLFARDEKPSPLRTINEYDFETGRTKELLRANAYEPFWSPDDSRIVYLQNTDGKWQVWTVVADFSAPPALLSATEFVSLYGWADAHTLLASDLQTLSWLGDDGSVKQTLSSTDLYGKDQFSLSSGNTVRIHPLNPDLLLVSAELSAPLPPREEKDATGKVKEGPKKEGQATQAIFLYEIHVKRRAILSDPELTSSFGEWSRDGLQIFFTGRQPAGGPMVTYRMFWDGTSVVKYREAYEFVVGE